MKVSDEQIRKVWKTMQRKDKESLTSEFGELMAGAMFYAFAKIYGIREEKLNPKEKP